jgi:type II secretion system protein H
MPRRCSPPNWQHIKGFTLIEILVVIVIISISVGLVVVNFTTGGVEKKVEEEVVRLQQLLRMAHQQSVIRAEEYGVRFYKTGYRFMKYDEQSKQWADIANDRLLRSRLITEPLELDLYIEQISVEIPESTDDDPEPPETTQLTDDNNKTQTRTPALNSVDSQTIKPQIFLLSSTELTPAFELRIRVPGSDVEELLRGLPQGEYTREANEE